MALNGNSPIIIIQAYKNIINKGNGGVAGKTKWSSNINTGNHIDLFSSFAKWQDVKSIKQLKSGVPIPFILHERTGIVSVSEEKDLSLTVDYEKGVKYQRQRKNSLSIKLNFNLDNIIANTLAGLLEYWWTNAIEYNYDISYYNAGNFIKQGHIGNFVKSTSTEKGNLAEISLSLDAGSNFVVEMIKKDKKEKNGVIIDRVSKVLKNINI